MQINLRDKHLTTFEKAEIEKLLKIDNIKFLTDLEQMWHLLDLIWDEYRCQNQYLNLENIAKFYNHPVWLLNGLFIEQHEDSMKHRHAISDWTINNNFKNVIDYGGGFGTLARLLAEKDHNLNIEIYEPHPSQFGLKKARKVKNIKFIDSLNSNYDCLFSIDVLEHVRHPLKDFSIMIKSVKTNGYLIVANAFSPMIKSHLPQNFHFRYSFNMFAKIMGLEVIGPLHGSHATIFQKVNNKDIDWATIKKIEKLSKFTFAIIKAIKLVLNPINKLTAK